ncbi:MAG: hypothetical protein QXT38_04120 [Candidatus Aenigmatarchaeota archaeon]
MEKDILDILADNEKEGLLMLASEMKKRGNLKLASIFEDLSETIDKEDVAYDVKVNKEIEKEVEIE